MKLYNTLTHNVEDFEPLIKENVRIYSCGPTVYDHIHIGNLSAFIYADTLRRTMQVVGYKVQHVMNFTDVDDKTIRRSRERYPDLAPEEALTNLTNEYKQIFLDDMQAIGNDVAAISFVNATDTMEDMRQLIRQLYADGFAYITDDGVYFSIEKYKASGKKYGQLLELNSNNTSEARIDNDEYDKESAHDFALWKSRKKGEPAWEFELDGHNLLGRPGWHIECSAMSAGELSQPFDIHTGGVDLIFPHHENEIAQSTAGKEDPLYAKYFVHNEHLLVDGKKMSKSLNNFITLRNIEERGFDPLAFRLMVLQSQYRSQSNFSWENLEAAQNRLNSLRSLADLALQGEDVPIEASWLEMITNTLPQSMIQALENDLAVPVLLAELSKHETEIIDGYSSYACETLLNLLTFIDKVLGLRLLETSHDITQAEKQILAEREQARNDKDWSKSDGLRDQLKAQGLGIRDTERGQIWFRL